MNKFLFAALLLALSLNSFSNERLLEAVVSSDLENVETIVESDSTLDLEYKDDRGMSSLAYAAELGLLEITKYLVRVGADIDSLDLEAIPVVVHSYINNHHEIYEYLITQSDSAASVFTGADQLLDSAASCDLAKMGELLEGGVRTEFKNQDGKTAIELALDASCLKGASLLIQKSNALYNVSKERTLGYFDRLGASRENALVLSIYKKKLELGDLSTEDQKYFLARAAFAAKEMDLADSLSEFLASEVSDDRAGALLIYGVRNEWENLNNVLKERIDGLSWILEKILKKVADTGDFDLVLGGNHTEKVTALVWSVNEDCIETAAALVGVGADINFQSSVYGTNALVLATKNRNIEIVQILIGAGVNPDLKEYWSAVVKLEANRLNRTI